MSSEHKAFIFDYLDFEIQLKDILENALKNGEISSLKKYIIDKIVYLKDPYEGEQLNNDWESMLEIKDPHQYGDFALTKFYNPHEDIGIGYDWDTVQNILSSKPACKAIILGSPVGSDNNYFDPGKLGSYFQSPVEVKRNLELLEDLIDEDPNLASFLDGTLQMLRSSSQADKGLYITF
jgi:hypothetical protein